MSSVQFLMAACLLDPKRGIEPAKDALNDAAIVAVKVADQQKQAGTSC
jgi:hypothetical protein